MIIVSLKFILLTVHSNRYHYFQGETRENVTISELSFVPTTDDDGKSIICRAENPKVAGLSMEASWTLDVVCELIFFHFIVTLKNIRIKIVWSINEFLKAIY